MSQDLNLFFRENVEDKQIEVEIEVSKRFKDGEGNILPWKFRLLESGEIGKIQKDSVKIVKSKTGIQSTTDMEYVKTQAILQSVVFPNLKDVKLQENYDALTEKELLEKMLEGRELERLKSKMLREQGFIEDFGELVVDAKN